MNFKCCWVYPLPKEDIKFSDYDSKRNSGLPNRNRLLNMYIKELDNDWFNSYERYNTCMQTEYPVNKSTEITYRKLLRNYLYLLQETKIDLNMVHAAEILVEDNQIKVDCDLDGISLSEMMKFSPGYLKNNTTLLLVLLQIMSSVHVLHSSYHLPHGNLKLNNIFLNANQDILLGAPCLQTILDAETVKQPTSNTKINCSIKSNSNGYTLQNMTLQWVLRKISNYDYLIFLNELAGRHIGDPMNSSILPWVTNFESESGLMRDLSKTKYHLTKGEAQLDANFKTAVESQTFLSQQNRWQLKQNNIDDNSEQILNQLCDDLDQKTTLKSEPKLKATNSGTSPVPKTDTSILMESGSNRSTNSPFSPHHLLDMMPNLSYYTYMARKTPIPILTKYVRPIYQPQEFPPNMNRLYDSTPDECIPEFYTDPSVFTSIHTDMPDLGLPSWCPTPEHFIAYHSALLESEAVSSSLHHWIDLTFGYKLLGTAAIQAKNLHLELAGDQTTLRRSGVTCLFRTPHPRRSCSSKLGIYFGDSLPWWQFPSSVTNPNTNQDELKSLDHVNSYNSEQSTNFENQIWLPDDYNPLELIETYENMCHFLANETSFPIDVDLPKLAKVLALPYHNPALPSAYENLVNMISWVEGLLQSVTSNRFSGLSQVFRQDIESVACLIVELSTYSKVNYLEADQWNHTNRVYYARLNARKYWEFIPNCLHQVIDCIIQPFAYESCEDDFRRRFLPSITDVLNLLIDVPVDLLDLLHVRDYLKKIAANKFSSSLLDSYIPRSPLWIPFLPNDAAQMKLLRLKKVTPIPTDVLNLLHSHIKLASESDPVWFVNAIRSTELLTLYSISGGTKFVENQLLTLILNLYKADQLKQLSQNSHGHLMANLYSRKFLRRLLAYCGVPCFLHHIVPRIVLGLVGGSIINMDDKPAFLYQRNHTNAQTNPEIESNAVGRIDHCGTLNSPKFDTNSNDFLMRTTISSPKSIFADAVFFEQSVDEIGVELRSIASTDDLVLNPKEGEQNVKENLSFLFEDANTDSSSQPSYTDPSQDEVQGHVGSPSVTDPVTHPQFCDSDDNQTRKSSIGTVPLVVSAADSIGWLAKRIGPIMTAKYIVKPLLATLVLCYEGTDQLSVFASKSNLPDLTDSSTRSETHLPIPVHVTDRALVGDRSASACLRCLEQLVHFYGIAMVLDIYLPFIRKTVNNAFLSGLPKLCDLEPSEENEIQQQQQQQPSELCSKSCWNHRTLASLVASLTLLHQLTTYLPDSHLIEYLQDSLLQDVLTKAIRITGRHDSLFPCGVTGRRAILYKLIDAIYVIGLRVGFELTRTMLTSVFQIFFSLFDCVQSENQKPKSRESISAGTPITTERPTFMSETEWQQILTELHQTFDRDLARLAYIPFCRLAGGTFVDDCLYNAHWIQSLVSNEISKCPNLDLLETGASLTLSHESESISFGQTYNEPIRRVSNTQIIKSGHEATLLASSILYNDGGFHLRGPWRQIFRQKNELFPNIPSQCTYHGVQVACFGGHTARINSFDVMSTENCFITSSRDKTVQLWSLSGSYNPGYSALNSSSSSSRLVGSTRSSSITYGRNTPVELNSTPLSARVIYRSHRKPVISARYLEIYRLIVSTDGHLLLWDPYTGQTIRTSQDSKSTSKPSFVALEKAQIPYGAIICGDQAGHVHLIDPRTMKQSYPGSLRLSSGIHLGSHLFLKDRHKSTESMAAGPDISQVQIPDVYSATTNLYQTDQSAISKSLFNLTNQLHPQLNQSVSFGSTVPNTNSSSSVNGLLSQLAVMENGHDVVCGFTSGMITILDLRNGQVVHVLKGHIDAIQSLHPHGPDTFVSSSADRNLVFWNLKNFMETDLTTSSYSQPVSTQSFIKFQTSSIPGIQSISCLASYGPDLILCATPFASSSTISYPAAAVMAVVNSLAGGSLSDSSNHTLTTLDNPNTTRPGSGGSVLGSYQFSNSQNPEYQILGRVGSGQIRGLVTALSTLPETGLFLMGSETGAVSLLY